MQFETSINKFGALTEKATGKLHKDTALFLSRAVINATPVLTGLARGSWVAGRTLTRQWDPEKTDKSGATVKAETRSEIMSHPPFSVTYIFNNTPYIVFLNDGTQGRRPYAMLSVAMNSHQVSFKK